MKRDENLHPLSWEHHNGLVIARRIRKGLEKDAESSILSDYVAAMWEDHLAPHFGSEEQLLLPLMERHGADEALIRQLREQHAHLRELADRVRTTESSDALAAFSESLTAHIRFEEREFFPHAERIIPQNELRELGQELHARYNEQTTGWEPRFW